MPDRVKTLSGKTVLAWMGRAGIAFVAFLALYFVIDAVAPRSLWRIVPEIGAMAAGVWLAIRLLRLAASQAVWRLRNRLLVTYLFIALVPILLIVMLAATGGLFLIQQIAVYLVTSELDRRVETIRSAAESVQQANEADRPGVVRGMIDLFYLQRYPGIEVLVHDGAKTIRYPENGNPPSPNVLWSDVSGVLTRDARFYIWTHKVTPWGDITITVPLTREFLVGLVPDLGVVDLIESGTNRAEVGNGANNGKIPAAANRLDNEFSWYAVLPVSNWEQPGRESRGFLVVRTRTSAVLSAVFNRKADLFQNFLLIFLVIGVAVFFIVEVISLVIGVAMTRTITGAVHRLYEGTQRMIEGDFSHRIEVRGRDQLAELSRSFNTMTENLERLLVVAKEKERLQSEIEIAREVQSQLYPRSVPKSQSLRVTAICQPARMVSGDYYDYECIRDTQVALAIGDVAGKGISAALLMATLQSSLRTQLQGWLEASAAAPGNGTAMKSVSTSRLVARLNNQLYAYTSPEKYATFCLGVFDENGSAFQYTNAGHLPPLLIREGMGHRLDVNGTVVGAFPFSNYDESRVEMKSGDLLVFFTDGITEPENEYGEMFGEDRLTDLIARNAHRSESEIIDLVLSSVHQWTASEELQDDMTILMARRL